VAYYLQLTSTPQETSYTGITSKCGRFGEFVMILATLYYT